jgi:hypothetical protein
MRQYGLEGMLAAQSESKLQVIVQVPMVLPLLSLVVQNWPVGQWLRPGAGEQPSWHLWVEPSHTRPESTAPQSASVVQPQKLPLVPVSHAWPSELVLQAPALPPEPVVQTTHLLVLVSHVGVEPLHWESMTHWTHRPLVVLHCGVDGVPAQSVLLVQPPHVFVDGLHTGVVDGQSPPLRHWTHVLVAVLQTGVEPPQPVLAVHWTHAPVVVLHTGVPV